MTLGGRSKSAAGGGKKPFNFKIEADLWIILDLLAKETQMNRNQIINDVLRSTLAIVAKTSFVNIEEIIQRRIRQEVKNRKNDNAQTIRLFLSMLKTFDDELKEKSMEKKAKEKISHTEEIQMADTKTNQKTFAQTVTYNAEIAANLNIAITMLQNLLYTFEIIDTSSAESFVYSARSRCSIYIAELQNILKNYENFLDNTKLDSDNWYKQNISKKIGKYPDESKKIFRLSEFREEFSDLVLMMRNKCLDICNKTQEKATYEEDAIYESCRYVSVSINELCRTDIDLVIDSYEYDESTGFLSADMSELKRFQKCKIDKVYCDGEPCEFSVMMHDENESPYLHSDFTIRFKPCSKFSVDKTTKHATTIMSGCIEFSYYIEKQFEKNTTFIDYHRGKIPNFKL